MITKRKIIFFIIFFILLIGLSLYSTYKVLNEKKQDSILITLAGRQSSIIQQYVKDFFFYLKTNEIEPVQKSIKTFEMTQRALIEGGLAPLDLETESYILIQKKHNKTLISSLKEIENNWKELKNFAVSLIEEKEQSIENFKLLTSRSNKLSTQMYNAVVQLKKNSEEKLLQVQYMELIIFSITFILFLISIVLLLKLGNINKNLENIINQRTKELKSTQTKLLDSARKVGMSEIATGVLHNVGNILNSINVTTDTIIDKMNSVHTSKYNQGIDLLRQNIDNLNTFLCDDPKGKILPEYIIKSNEHINTSYVFIKNELTKLQENVNGIKNIISIQQSLAGQGGLIEEISLSEIIEQAIQVNESSIIRHELSIARDITDIVIKTDKLKLLQILINLISNAKYALLARKEKEPKKLISITTEKKENKIQIIVSDNGIGISKEQLNKIFEYGFTTKKSGHGFGLHNSALAAKELNAKIEVHSEGLQKGATFTVTLPY